MGWFNLKSMLLLSFLTFKLIEWSSAWLPIWDVLSYIMILAASYWFGFVAYRWLKRDYLALTIASYRKAVLITGKILKSCGNRSESCADSRTGLNSCVFVLSRELDEIRFILLQAATLDSVTCWLAS